jgi:hypothetical protein
MQKTLGFKPIDAADAVEQQQRIAGKWLEEHPPAAAVSSQPKRSVGRPRKETVLVTSAEAQETVEDGAAAAATAAKAARTNWFLSPYIADVLDAVRKRSFSWKAAVADLQRSTPPGDKHRYARLSDSTVRGWYELRDGRWQLKAHLQAQLDHTAAPRAGRKSAMPAAVEDECKRALLLLRDKGVPVNSHVIRWTMQSVFTRLQPNLLGSMKLSQQYLSYWVHKELNWSWRSRTTAASKLPLTWEDDGVLMAKRIAAHVQMYNVHPSLVVNLDQTGVHLVPSAGWTYERKGSAAVATIGAEDKRQITAVVASSLHGDLLPLQLIFAGKTDRCLPPATFDSKAARVHLTCSENHWSSQETMRQWLQEVLQPYINRCIAEHQLNSDASAVLVLDVWAVHKSEQFRMLLRTHYPHIHLVFVPANCTSKLQVADVALQRHFKVAIRSSFNTWAAQQIDEQLQSGKVVGFGESFKMGSIKPLALQWCVDSWKLLQQRRDLILWGWGKCCTSLYNVHDREKRIAAMAEAASQKLDVKHIPDMDEIEADESELSDLDESDSDSELEPEEMDVASTDENKDELDVSTLTPVSTRKSTRKRKAYAPSGYMINSQQLAISGDSS